MEEDKRHKGEFVQGTQDFVTDCIASNSPFELSTDSTNSIFKNVSKAKESKTAEGKIDDEQFQATLHEAGDVKQLDILIAKMSGEDSDIDQDPETRKKVKVLMTEGGNVASVSYATEERQLDKWGIAKYTPKEDSIFIQEYKRNGDTWAKVGEDESMPASDWDDPEAWLKKLDKKHLK